MRNCPAKTKMATKRITYHGAALPALPSQQRMSVGIGDEQTSRTPGLESTINCRVLNDRIGRLLRIGSLSERLVSGSLFEDLPFARQSPARPLKTESNAQ